MKSFRKRSRYSRVSNDKKHLLVDLVINKKFKLCKATQLLGIKYSTAKTVMRLFRRENKIFRRDIEEERSLKMILQNLHYKSDPKHKLFLVSKKIDKINRLESKEKCILNKKTDYSISYETEDLIIKFIKISQILSNLFK